MYIETDRVAFEALEENVAGIQTQLGRLKGVGTHQVMAFKAAAVELDGLLHTGIDLLDLAVEEHARNHTLEPNK